MITVSILQFLYLCIQFNLLLSVYFYSQMPDNIDDPRDDPRFISLISDIYNIITPAVRQNDESTLQRLLGGIGRISPILVPAINRIIAEVRTDVANETIT